MRISVGDQSLKIQRWESKDEMVEAVARCEGGNIVLGLEAEQQVDFFSVFVRAEPSGQCSFAIGICSEGHGLVPQVAVRPESLELIFGFNREVVAVRLRQREVAYRIELDCLFHTFVELPKEEMLLAVHEIGIVALAKEGQVLWRYDCEIIDGFVIHDNQMELRFMDGSTVSVDIQCGKVRQSDHHE
jgi:hypothetical protein